jgi:hypothetical protein
MLYNVEIVQNLVFYVYYYQLLLVLGEQSENSSSIVRHLPKVIYKDDKN